MLVKTIESWTWSIVGLHESGSLASAWDSHLESTNDDTKDTVTYL